MIPLIAGAAGFSMAAAARPATRRAPSAPELRRVTYQSARTGAERDYFVYLPRGFAQARSWPVLLFLHGDGERGDAQGDLDYVLCHGPLYEAWIQKRDLPFVIVAPQLPLFGLAGDQFFKDRNRSWIPLRLADGAPPRPDAANVRLDAPMQGIPATDAFPPLDDPDGWQALDSELIAMVDRSVAAFKGDPRRVYVTGLSSGGFGAWYLAAHHADKFAAFAPVVGYGHPELAAPVAAAKLPVWQFAGGRDPAVPLQFFYAAMNRLEALGHPEPRFSIQEDLGHFTWVRVYGGNDVYDWMLAHTRGQA